MKKIPYGIRDFKTLKEKDKNNYNNIYKKAKEQINKYNLNLENEKKYIIIFTGTNYTLEEV